MPNASKVAEVEAIKGYLNGSVAALLTEYRGLKVKDMGELRDSLRGSQTDYRVLKNTLTGIAASEAGFQELLPLLDGPTAVAFVHGDPVQAAKDLAGPPPCATGARRPRAPPARRRPPRHPPPAMRAQQPSRARPRRPPRSSRGARSSDQYRIRRPTGLRSKESHQWPRFRATTSWTPSRR